MHRFSLSLALATALSAFIAPRPWAQAVNSTTTTVSSSRVGREGQQAAFPGAGRSVPIGMDRGALIRADPRLEGRVTIASGRIYIADLLEKLSEQSGVTLSAGEKDGAGGEPVVVFVRETRLADVMIGLWSLVSYRGASWRWVREEDKSSGGGDSFTYRLTRPAPAQALAATIEEEIQQDLERDFELLFSALKMSPEQLALATTRRPELGTISSGSGQGGNRQAVAALSALLPTPEARRRALRQVLRQDAPFRVSVAQFPDALRIYAETQRQKRERGDRPLAYLELSKRMIQPDLLVPSLSLSFTDEGGSGGGPVLLSGFDAHQGWRDALRDRWVLENDRRVHREREAQTIPADAAAAASPANSPPVETNEPDNAAAIRGLGAFHARTGIPVLARVPEREAPIVPPQKEQVGEFLDRLRRRYYAKWRDNTLLISHPAAARDSEEHQVIWEVISRMRAEEKTDDPEGMISFSTVKLAATRLSEEQLRRLEKTEKPPRYAQFFRMLVYGRDWFGPLAALSPALTEQLFQEKGVRLMDLSPDFQQRLTYYPRTRDRLEGARVRVAITDKIPDEAQPGKSTGAAERKERHFTLSVLSSKGEELIAFRVFWSDKIYLPSLVDG